jgi:hypothetical protein
MNGRWQQACVTASSPDGLRTLIVHYMIVLHTRVPTAPCVLPHDYCTLPCCFTASTVYLPSLPSNIADESAKLEQGLWVSWCTNT